MGSHEKQLFHLHAKRFETPEAAHAALTALSQTWRYHQLDTCQVIDHKRYACKGRPTPTSPLKAIAWQIHAQSDPLRRSLRPTSNRVPVLFLAPIFQPATSAMRR